MNKKMQFIYNFSDHSNQYNLMRMNVDLQYGEQVLITSPQWKTLNRYYTPPIYLKSFV